MIQHIGAACALVVGVYTSFEAPPSAREQRLSPVPERITEGGKSGGGGSSCKYGDGGSCEDPVEKCKRRCEEAWEKENERCRTLRTKKQREKCWRENNEKLAKCTRDCEA